MKKFELKKKKKTLAAVLVNLILKAFGIQQTENVLHSSQLLAGTALKRGSIIMRTIKRLKRYINIS